MNPCFGMPHAGIVLGAMFTRKETLFVVIFLLIAALIIFRPQNRDRVEALMPTGGIEVYTRAFQQEGLVAPFDCEVFVRAVGGSAGATSALGIGTTPANFRPLLTGLPQEITDEVAELGEFREGDAIPFAIKTT